LAKLYNTMKENGNGKGKFEVVYAAFDKTVADFDAFVADMPWCAIPFGDKAGERWLAKLLCLSELLGELCFGELRLGDCSLGELCLGELRRCRFVQPWRRMCHLRNLSVPVCSCRNCCV
jgi:hypothetical protein